MFTKYKRLAPPNPPDRDKGRGEIYVNCSYCALDIEWSLTATSFAVALRSECDIILHQTLL